MPSTGRSRGPCKCRFPSDRAHSEALSSFIRAFGDDIPEDMIREATRPEKLSNWKTFCDCDDPAKIVSGGHWERSDWYLCTVKHIATHRDYRGRGLGKAIVRDVVKDAFSKGCLVLGADITVGNIPSERIFKGAGFEVVNNFCWGRGEKPANILHYVRMPPKDGKCV